MLTLQRVLVGVSLAKRVLVDVGFAKSIGRYWSSKKVLVDDGLTNVAEFFTGDEPWIPH